VVSFQSGGIDEQDHADFYLTLTRVRNGQPAESDWAKVSPIARRNRFD